jgi:hypothetical protein
VRCAPMRNVIVHRVQPGPCIAQCGSLPNSVRRNLLPSLGSAATARRCGAEGRQRRGCPRALLFRVSATPAAPTGRPAAE